MQVLLITLAASLVAPPAPPLRSVPALELGSEPASLAFRSRPSDPLGLPKEHPWSLSLYGGFGQLDDGDYSQSVGGVFEEGTASYDGGLAAGFAVGYAVAPRWTVEFDYTYRRNEISDIQLGGGALTEGDYASVSWMLSAEREFGDGPVRPYFGAGAGVLQEIDIDFEASNIEGQDYYAFAWQVQAGATWQLSDRWRLFAEARYLSSSGENLDVEATGDTYSADYDHLGLFAGATWSF